jgi:hypothetical protein
VSTWTLASLLWLLQATLITRPRRVHALLSVSSSTAWNPAQGGQWSLCAARSSAVDVQPRKAEGERLERGVGGEGLAGTTRPQVHPSHSGQTRNDRDGTRGTFPE